MARRTATITQLRYYKKHSRQADKFKDFGALPDGTDFLPFVLGVWQGMSRHTLRDHAKQRYCQPADFIARGRTLTLTAMAGSYGEPASVRDVETGNERLRHNGDLTNSIPLRVVVLVPTRGTSALIFVEHVEGAIFGQRFIDHLTACWDQRFADWTLKSSTLTRSDAWLKNAQLQAVTAEVYDHTADLEDSGTPSHYGILRSTIVPKKGMRYLPAEVLQRLAGGSAADRALLMGMREEPDEIKVTLGDGEQTKTFVLGKDRTPAVRLLVTDYNEPALTDDRFRAWCGAEAREHFRTVGADWSPSMLDGPWPAEDLAMKIEFRR